MNLRLLRWIFFHVVFASFPIFASSTVFALAAAKDWHFRPGEVLFFTFMISSIALGEMFELFYRDKQFTTMRVCVAGILLVGVVVSTWFYGIVIMNEVINRAALDVAQRILVPSFVLAGVFLALGTVVSFTLDRAERSRG
jgi:hypothetical protein